MYKPDLLPETILIEHISSLDIYFQFVLYSSFSIKTPLWFLEEWYKWETTVMTILVKFSF